MPYRRTDDADSAVEAAIAAIKAQLREGLLVPGQRLVAAELATRLGVSGSALREALGRLAGEGLIELAPHRGASVRRMEAADLAETYELREAIEGMAARLAARHLTRASAAQLRAALKASDAGAAQGVAAFVPANLAFHAAVLAASGRQRFARLADQLSLPLDRLAPRRLALPATIAASASDHRAIARAILARDEAGAEAAMRAHLRRAAAAMA
jgi:DNA-binding GntR family transcriptional regulator